MTLSRLTARPFLPIIRPTAIALLATLLACLGMAPLTLAAPDTTFMTSVSRDQNVDWMSPDTAASLNIGIDVLVPSWVPAPFDSVAPSVSASEGYYQLYWMVTGGSPTFLYIEGTAGGGLPAGSPANLNIPLSINDSVQGWNAIHDIGIPDGSDTPIYDQVWWIANGVLYTVSSNNMTGSDTMSLANSLITLQPPVVEQPVPTDPPVPTEPPYVEPTVPVVDTPQEPVVDTTAPPVDTTENAGDTGTQSQDVPVDTQTDETAAGTVSESEPAQETSQSSDQPWSPARDDRDVPSDGTNGPRPPMIGTDGTGGVYDTALPSILFRP